MQEFQNELDSVWVILGNLVMYAYFVGLKRSQPIFSEFLTALQNII